MMTEKKIMIGKKIQKDIASFLLAGQIGVLATDTLYGVVGSALLKETVERIFAVRQRDLKKPLIILISSIEDLKYFAVEISQVQEKKLQAIWPGPVSVVLDCQTEKFAHLQRGTKTLAFRLPASEKLLNLLKKTGPLVAPSANLSGQPPAQTIMQAQKYFQEKVDFYVDAGQLKSEPSTIIVLSKNGEERVLRGGK
jgi:L-threonylcarbamoyladenylate synthase